MRHLDSFQPDVQAMPGRSRRWVCARRLRDVMTVQRAGADRPLADLTDRRDVEALVKEFYTRAFADPQLAPIFRDIVRMDLEKHLPVMCDFWQTVLFRAGLYRRNALQVHAELHALSPLSSEHFARWLALWTGTVDDCFSGPKAELAKTQAGRIAYSISRPLLGETGSEFVIIGRHRRSLT